MNSAPELPISVTLFRDLAATQCESFKWSFDELAENFRNADNYETKASCPLLKLATFGDQRSDGGSLLHDANVLEITGIEGDYDGGQMSLEDARSLLYEQGVSAVLCTAPSNTQAMPRWRAFCPLSHPYAPGERERLVARLNGVLGGILAPNSFRLAQSYFAGRVNGAEYKVEKVSGEPIDLLSILDEKAIYPKPQEAPLPFDPAKVEVLEILAPHEHAPAGPIDPKAPLEVARAFLNDRVGAQGMTDLLRWQGQFYIARPTHYEHLPDECLRKDLYHWLEQQTHVVVVKPKRGTSDAPTLLELPIKPNRHMVADVRDATAAETLIDVEEVPAWLDGAKDMPEASDLIALSNGLLHIPTRRLLPHTRRFYNLNATGFPYDPHAPRSAELDGFLRSLWKDDTESIETLQELFGLALTGDTRYQKAFLIVGPKRSGKGTIADMLTALVGKNNVVAPMFASIGQQFGQQSMIGKKLAIISDARLGGKADIAAITENILRVSGDDTVSIPRKFLNDWTAKLKVRFLVLSNELPALIDHSGALPSRFIIWHLTESFLGREDLTLKERLLGQMPSILLWALDGLDRLRSRGNDGFRQPESALDKVRQLETLSSPILNFAADRCIVASGATIECKRLFDAWSEWCRGEHRDYIGTLQVFGRNLGAAFPAIKVTRPRTGQGRERHYEGIRLRDATDPDEPDGADLDPV